MPEASAVLRALEQESSREGDGGGDEGASGQPYLRLVRSKNRFRNPSSGGWMDCLINVRLVRIAVASGLVVVGVVKVLLLLSCNSSIPWALHGGCPRTCVCPISATYLAFAQTLGWEHSSGRSRL